MKLKKMVVSRIWKLHLKNKYTEEEKDVRMVSESAACARLLVRDEWEIIGKIEEA